MDRSQEPSPDLLGPSRYSHGPESGHPQHETTPRTATRSLHHLQRYGYCVLEQALDPSSAETLTELAQGWRAARAEPFELEAEVGYPGAPQLGEAGASTVRRYLQVYQRDPLVHDVLVEGGIVDRLARLFGEPPRLVLAHHNCLMTKEPHHSSATPWHRDLRYWSYAQGELLTAWIPLGTETPANGGLHVVPSSHHWNLAPESLDSNLSLTHHGPIADRIRRESVPLILQRGDLLFFHCRLLHSAPKNTQPRTKQSFAFTFRQSSDMPLPTTRSAASPEIPF
jgi:phytanoyl-CoA hydroxylase